MLDEVDWLIARKKSQTGSDKLGCGKKPFTLMLTLINAEEEEMHLSASGAKMQVMLCFINV